MKETKPDVAGGVTTIVMGALIIGSSLTWGAYMHWIWPIGVVVIFAGLLNLQMRRNMSAFQILVVLVLIGLTAVRFMWIDKVVPVEHKMTWSTSSKTVKGEGKKVGESIVELSFVNHPGYIQRLYSSELATFLAQKFKDKTISAKFEVTYDFHTPRKYRIRAIEGKRLRHKKSTGAIQLFGASGGQKPSVDDKNSPWAFPKKP